MDDVFVEEFAKKRVSKSVELMSALEQLNDPQCELVLLRVYMGLNGLGVYTASDARLFAFVASRIQFVELQNHILRGCDGVPVGDRFVSAQDSLQLVLSNVDLTKVSTKESAPPKPMHYLVDLYFSGICENLHTKFNFSERQTAVFQCLRVSHAQNFLLVTPIEGLGQRTTPPEYQMILRYMLMIPLFSNGTQCPLCMSRMDVFEEYAIHCQKQLVFKYRHDMVRDVLYDIFWRAGIPAKKEAPVNFLTPPGEVRSTIRPTDVLVYSWNGGKHTCVDLTGVSPLSGFDSGVFIIGQAATKAAEENVHKHDKACKDNQHRFMPFAFDTFGFLTSEAVEFLRRVQMVMNTNVMTAVST